MKYDKLNKMTPYYEVMQDFMAAIKNKDKKQIIRLLHSKQAVGKQMHQTLLTFKYNYTGILNSIYSSYSNGCLEGVNRKIKQIERTTYGYSNFRHLLIRIRLEENIIKEKEPNSFFKLSDSFSKTIHQQNLINSPYFYWA